MRFRLGRRFCFGSLGIFHLRLALHRIGSRHVFDLVDGEQPFKRCGRIGIDRAACTLEFFHVAANQGMAHRGIDFLVQHRDDAAAQILTRRLRRKIRPVDRIAGRKAERHREQRAEHLRAAYDPCHP